MNLEVLLFKESVEETEMWVAQCIQKDIVAQGNSIEEAKESFGKTLLTNIFLGRKYNIFEGLSNTMTEKYLREFHDSKFEESRFVCDDIFVHYYISNK